MVLRDLICIAINRNPYIVRNIKNEFTMLVDRGRSGTGIRWKQENPLPRVLVHPRKEKLIVYDLICMLIEGGGDVPSSMLW